MKSKIIIVEGATGVWKSTVTNKLRELIPSSLLFRLSGLPKETDSAINCFLYHSAILNAIDDCSRSGLNVIIDRSFVSNYIYSQLGLKDYDFTQEMKQSLLTLRHLSRNYDIYYFTLTAEEDDYIDRLKRDKAEYINFSVESSMQQQEKYLTFHKQYKCVNYIRFNLISTHDTTSDEVTNRIMELTM